MRSLYWLRHDLRMHDNQTLNAMVEQSSDCAFVFSTHQTLKLASSFRRNFFYQALDDLKLRLKAVGHELILTHKPITSYLAECLKEQHIEAVFFTREYAFDEIKEESAVSQLCLERDVAIKSFDQGTLVAQADLPFSLEQMPFIFTEFRKKLEANFPKLQLQPQPQQWPLSIPLPPDEKIDIDEFTHPRFIGGESAAISHLKHYIWKSQAIRTYKETRNNLIDFDDSTKFSPWLNAGCLSPRLIMEEVKKFEQEICENESTYWVLFELLWRDYFKFFSRKFGHKIFISAGITKGSSPNRHDQEAFQLWCQGKTAEPFINANMLELNQTGWMSNRGRQNVASYLIHDLGVNWTWGARYFEEKLIDYDPDLNWGNWLYLSGRGADPRARKFNIAKQAATYDPRGEYQKLFQS